MSHLLNKDEFIKKLMDFLKIKENVEFAKSDKTQIIEVHADMKGIPTMGYGFNVGDRSYEENIKAFKMAKIDIDDNMDKFLKSVSKDSKTKQYNLKNFTISITVEQAEELLKYAIYESSQRVEERIKKVKGAEYILPENNNDMYSQEFMALTSMAYNNPSLIGNNLLEAIANKNRATAWFEIAYNSNGGNSRGIQNRRHDEASMFGLFRHGQKPSHEEIEKALSMFEKKIPAIFTKINDVYKNADKDKKQEFIKATIDFFQPNITKLLDHFGIPHTQIKANNPEELREAIAYNLNQAISKFNADYRTKHKIDPIAYGKDDKNNIVFWNENYLAWVKSHDKNLGSNYPIFDHQKGYADVYNIADRYQRKEYFDKLKDNVPNTIISEEVSKLDDETKYSYINRFFWSFPNLTNSMSDLLVYAQHNELFSGDEIVSYGYKFVDSRVRGHLKAEVNEFVRDITDTINNSEPILSQSTVAQSNSNKLENPNTIKMTV